MEQFRVRNADPGKPRTLLLPLSLGISSLSLLYILDGHLQNQINRTGRPGFLLHVLLVRLPEWDPEVVENLLRNVKRRFSRHTYSCVSLADAHGNRGDENERNIQTAANGDNGQTAAPIEGLASSLPSVTSRIDVLNILRVRLTVRHAQTHACEGILWGDSTTRLAERVLAETAKGRGFSLPSLIADGDASWGLPFYYPMRDLLKKELLTFSDFVEPSLGPLLLAETTSAIVAPVASKNGSIDTLMRQYFASVEEQYPSIVANVVRTTGKLDNSTREGSRSCRLCKMQYVADATTAEDQSANGADIERGLCYGCTQAVPPTSFHLIPD